MGESKEYLTLTEETGNIHISEEVVAAIVVGAVRDVEGISGMLNTVGGNVADLMGKKNQAKGVRGVKIDMTGPAMVLDLYVTVRYGYAIPEVAEKVQTAVANAVEAMTGLAVNCVNVHVGGVSFE